MRQDHKQSQSFEDLSRQKRIGFFREFWEFLKYNKKWWLLPIIIMLVLLGCLVLLAETGGAPWIYTLF
ncbi:MAG: hypothetical protein JW828_04515 [Sedimentisphaerales bacterium]|nr:hypothetical protein [Sedimentisphaerales bacterium]